MTIANDTPATEDRGFVRAAKVVASMTLLSRIFGLARDAVCSRVFGAGPVWSAFAFAFLLPNLARRLFGEGALTGAFIPEYAKLLEEDADAAAKYASAMLGLTIAVVSALTIVGELILLALLFLTRLGDSGSLALHLSMVLLPFAPMICVTALIGGILQTHGRFAPTAAAPVILNICIITGVLGWKFLSGASLETAAFSAAGAVLAAGVLQIAWSLAAARHYTTWTRAVSGARSSVLRTLKKTGPVILGLGALQINTLLDGLIASWPVLVGSTIAIPGVGTLDYPLDESSNAALFFATRLYQFPLGVFGIALATAVFPLLAKQARDRDAFSRTLSEGLRLSFYIGLPATAGLLLVSHDLTAVIFAGGVFDAASVDRVSLILSAYALAVWAYTANHTLTRAYYAVGDTVTPMRVTLAMVVLNVGLNLWLIWPLGEAGLAYSTAITSSLQFVILSVLWPKRGAGSPWNETAFTGSVMWSFGLAGAMAGAVWISRWGLDSSGLLSDAWSSSLILLMVSITVGAGVYLALSLVFGRPEPRWLLGRRHPSKLG